jgi:hypothetical protein
MTRSTFPSTDRSLLRRHPERGSHEREEVYAILDAGLVCHVGLVVDGRALVIPMAYGRTGDRLFLHGAVVSRLLKHLAGGIHACVTVTHVDGVVLARSTFHSSLNYRSVVAFGEARRLEGEAQRSEALNAIVEQIAPGRVGEARPPNAAELAATEVVEFLIEEASAKIRSGPPVEPEADRGVPVWAGVVPLTQVAGTAVPAVDLADGILPSDVVLDWRRSQ